MSGKQYSITLTEEQLQEWRQAAKTLQHEASFVEKLASKNMISRYAYSPSHAAMVEGAEALSKLLSTAKAIPAAGKPTIWERIANVFQDDF
jgi:hypothetical protein